MAKHLMALTCFFVFFHAFAETHTFPVSVQRRGLFTLGKSGFVYQASIPKIEIVESSLGIDLSIDSYSLTRKEGYPKLPFKSFIFKGKLKDFSIDIKKGDSYFFKGEPVVAETMPCRCDKDLNKKFEKNDLGYKKLGSFYRATYLGDYRGIPLTKITLFPIRYFPLKKGVEVYPEMKVKIIHTKGKKIEFYSASSFEKVAKGNQNYLVVTPKRFRDALAEFISWKESKGFNINVVEMESFGTTFEAIRTGIQTLNKTWPFSYALLVGDEGTFPTEYVKTSNSDKTPSDMKYFTFGGVADRIPDVHYGRMAISKSREISHVVNKWKNYELNAERMLKGFDQSIGIASNEGFNPTDVEYMKQMNNPLVSAFGVKANYFFQDDRNTSATGLADQFDRGAAWVNYIGHGSGPAWNSIRGEDFSTSHVRTMSGGNMNSVVIDVACQNGRFKKDDRLGMTLINHKKDSGSVAYYGGSVDISWHPPAIMAVGINKALASKSYSSVGEVIEQGQLHLINTYEDEDAALENLVWYHLLGDPSLSLPWR